MFRTAIQDITSVYPRGIYEILHFKTYFQGVRYSCFPLCQTLTLPLCSGDIFSHIANWLWWRECTQLVWVCSGSEREKKHSLKSLSFLMMSTQRQWGAALISVTCPCASHQLHYGSISHASSANWIACEVVTMTGARATSVPLLLQKMRVKLPREMLLFLRHEPLSYR